jgi:hypothetical protein
VPDPVFRPPATVSASAGFAATVAGGILVVVVVATQRYLWFNGYISEAGVASSAHPVAYRVGIGLLALGQLLFGLALAGLPWAASAPSTVPLPRWATAGWWGALLARIVPLTVALLVGASLFGGVSSAVSCSPGCPLPPHDSPTPADLIHGGTSILSVGLICLSILSLAYLCPVSSLTAPSRVAAVILVPLVAADGVAILAIGRGHVTGLLERAVLVSAIAWTLVACARILTAGRPRP